MRKSLAAVVAVAGIVLATGMGTATDASAATPGSLCAQFYGTSEPELSYGSTGTAVQELQCELTNSIQGLYLDKDGAFGDQTYNAVVKFQGCFGLRQDGIVGPMTWQQLDYRSNGHGFWCYN